MAVVYSTGAVNYRAGEGCTRKMLEDCVLDIYGGATAPTTADEAPVGTKLCRVTKASGAITTTGRSTPRVYKAVVGAGHVLGNHVGVNVTVDGVGPTLYTYEIIAEDDTDPKVAIKVARMLNDIAQLVAICEIDTNNIWVQGKIDGLDLTLADGALDVAVTITSKQAAARLNTLYFGPPSAGVISKASDIWSGVNLATGVASYFRFVLPGDTGILSTTDIRVQGAIATSGAELNMTGSTSLVIGATTTIDTGSITLPKSA